MPEINTKQIFCVIPSKETKTDLTESLYREKQGLEEKVGSVDGHFEMLDIGF